MRIKLNTVARPNYIGVQVWAVNGGMHCVEAGYICLADDRMTWSSFWRLVRVACMDLNRYYLTGNRRWLSRRAPMWLPSERVAFQESALNAPEFLRTPCSLKPGEADRFENVDPKTLADCAGKIHLAPARQPERIETFMPAKSSRALADDARRIFGHLAEDALYRTIDEDVRNEVSRWIEEYNR